MTGGIIGRAREQAWLDGVLKRTEAGRGGVALVRAPAGHSR